jgi:hypothetical protein
MQESGRSIVQILFQTLAKLPKELPQMKMCAAVFRVALLGALVIGNAVVPQISSADCSYPPDGSPVTITVQSCEAIDGQTNKEVLRSIGKGYPLAEARKMYTGALITGPYHTRWMYPSSDANPCRKFVKSSQVKMRVSRTCCDSGSWGKCVFGGNWLADMDAKPFDAFQ